MQGYQQNLNWKEWEQTTFHSWHSLLNEGPVLRWLKWRLRDQDYLGIHRNKLQCPNQTATLMVQDDDDLTEFPAAVLLNELHIPTCVLFSGTLLMSPFLSISVLILNFLLSFSLVVASSTNSKLTVCCKLNPLEF